MTVVTLRWGTHMVGNGPAPSTNPGKTLAESALPQRVRLALANQLRTIGDQFRRHLEGMALEASRSLGRQAQAEAEPAAANDLAAAGRLLAARTNACIDAFLLDLEAGIAGLRAPRVSRPLEDVSAPAGGLVLVDAIDMDEGAELAGIAARGESRNTLALQLLGHRYGVLAAGPAFDAEHLPVGPNALCHAIRSGAHAIELPLAARLALFRQFEKAVLVHYPALLDALNNRLAGDGILPHLSFVPVRVHAEGAATAREERVAAKPATKPAAPGDDPAFLHLRAQLARRRTLLAKLRPASDDERVREVLPQEDVLAGLRRMRIAGGRAVAPSDARQALLAQARQARGHGATLSDVDADVFELATLFAAQFQRELRPGSAGEQLAARLVLPLLQAGLRDHRVFVAPHHPARMLLDAVSLAGARWLAEDDLDAQALGLLQRAVGAVCEDPDAGADSFVAANHALQGGLQAAHRKHEMAERRQVDAARGRERLQLARRRAAEEIASVVAGRDVPRFHALLIEQAWADVLALTLLRGGEASDAWRDLRAATVAIVRASVAPAGIADPAFIARLQEALGQVGYHGEDAALIARQLANGRADAGIDLASRTELMVQLKARARLGEDNARAEETATADPLTHAEREALAALAACTAPCWIELADAGGDTWIRRRLAWVGPGSGQALLLNRRGMRVDEPRLDHLARLLAGGRLRLLDADVQPAEAAWQATYANLERLAGGREARDDE